MIRDNAGAAEAAAMSGRFEPSNGGIKSD